MLLSFRPPCSSSSSLCDLDSDHPRAPSLIIDDRNSRSATESLGLRHRIEGLSILRHLYARAEVHQRAAGRRTPQQPKPRYLIEASARRRTLASIHPLAIFTVGSSIGRQERGPSRLQCCHLPLYHRKAVRPK